MSEQRTGSQSSFTPWDASLQAVSSFYDGAFAYLKQVNPAGAPAVNTASSAFGYTFLGVGVVVGTATDGVWNGGVKNVVTGYSALSVNWQKWRLSPH